MGDLPRTFTLQLAWEHSNEREGNIAATLDAISEYIDLSAHSTDSEHSPIACTQILLLSDW